MILTTTTAEAKMAAPPKKDCFFWFDMMLPQSMKLCGRMGRSDAGPYQFILWNVDIIPGSGILLPKH
jgi:hypothetical protein